MVRLVCSSRTTSVQKCFTGVDSGKDIRYWFYLGGIYIPVRTKYSTYCSIVNVHKYGKICSNLMQEYIRDMTLSVAQLLYCVICRFSGVDIYMIFPAPFVK